MSLSDRVRPDVEAAPWVVEEIKKLEAERDALQVTLQVPAVKDSLTTQSRLDAAAFREERDEARALLNGVLQDIRMVEAERDALLAASKAVVDFVDGPGEAKRPDVFFRIMGGLRAAIDAARAKPCA